MIPVIDSGYRLPISEGFVRFVSEPLISKGTETYLSELIAEEKPDPYDSHPVLRDRLRAIQSAEASSVPQNSEPASTLLSDLMLEEARLLHTLNPSIKTADLKLLAWQDFGEFIVRQWREELERCSCARLLFR